MATLWKRFCDSVANEPLSDEELKSAIAEVRLAAKLARDYLAGAAVIAYYTQIEDSMILTARARNLEIEQAT